MYAKIEKTKVNKSTAGANSVSQKDNANQGLGFIDNRPEAVSQRKLVVQLGSKKRKRESKNAGKVIAKIETQTNRGVG